MRQLTSTCLALLLSAITFSAPAFSQDAVESFSQSQNLPNFFAEQFYMSAEDRVKHQVSDVRGLLFVPAPDASGAPVYKVVTNFGPGALKTQSVANVRTLEEASKWVMTSLQTAEFMGVEIKKLDVPLPNGNVKTLYWVGHKAFESQDEAQAQITMAKTVAETQGGNFEEMVQAAATAPIPPEQIPPIEIKTPAQFQKEEELALKFLDQLDIGNEMFGPLQGVPSGEPITWQSFGETSWRQTNLESRNYSDQVGFWTNRIIFKGLRAPGNTIDPFIEATAALETNGTDFKSTLVTVGGLEWRPFARNPFLSNFRPWGIPLLDWVKSYRFVLEYADRRNIKDEIEGSSDSDLRAGVTIFYEGGIEVPPADEGSPTTLPEYIRRYMWWEYFGDYKYNKTNFSAQQKFDAFIFNSSIIIGFKTPGIPLPANPFFDDFVLMPYMRLEHVNNTEFSFDYQNRLFLVAGVRWMPFNSYRYKDNEWLYKTKVFMEYVGVGGVEHYKQNGEAPNTVDRDLRFGISLSSRRF